jgi:hypothetical protein
MHDIRSFWIPIDGVLWLSTAWVGLETAGWERELRSIAPKLYPLVEILLREQNSIIVLYPNKQTIFASQRKIVTTDPEKCKQMVTAG